MQDNLSGITSRDAVVDMPLLKTGEVIGEWWVVEGAKPLGEGAFGEVWLARRRQDSAEKVALKVLKSNGDGDSEQRERFEREQRVLLNLRHPNIVSVVDSGYDQPRKIYFLAMELVRGPLMLERISAGPMALTELLPMFRKLANALARAHALELAHRDLKPENIKMRLDGEPVMLDFGIVRIGDGGTLTVGRVLGTPAYMAPLRHRAAARDFLPDDVYALGQMIAECLTGRAMFRPEQGEVHDLAYAMRVLDQKKTFVLEVSAGPPELRLLLRRMVQPDADSRPSAAEVDTELGRIAARHVPAPLSAIVPPALPPALPPTLSPVLPPAILPAHAPTPPTSADPLIPPPVAVETQGASLIDSMFGLLRTRTPRPAILWPTAAEAEAAFREGRHVLRCGGEPREVRTHHIGGAEFRLCRIPAGEFWMGLLPLERERMTGIDAQHAAWLEWEQEATRIRLNRGFWMMEALLTQRQYEALTGKNPSHFQSSGPDAPVEQLSWIDALDLTGLLSRKTGQNWRMPVEAEWEWAARGGQEFRYAGSDDPVDAGWFSQPHTHPVREKTPNNFGLYDMSGNVWEMTADIWRPRHPGGFFSDPREENLAHSTSPSRTGRGGSWGSDAFCLRLSARDSCPVRGRSRSIGVRLVVD